MQLNFNKLLVLLLTLCVNFGYGQQNVDEHINGVYKSSGAAFVINKNKTFLIIAHGTLLNGTWKLENDLIYLKPKKPDAKFYVYARKNPSIKSGIRICVIGDRLSSAILIGKFPDKMQPLFYEGANCREFANVHLFNEKIDTITLLERQSDEHDRGIEIPKVMYHFASGECNDFILKISKDGLYVINDNSDEPIHKSTVEEVFSNAEEIKFLSESFDADFKMVNNGYNTHDEMDQAVDLAAYRYDREKNIYIYQSGDTGKRTRL